MPSILPRFTRDLTAEARAGRLEPVRAREAEIARVVDILLRHGKNNPALVGPAGVGKTAIAEGLAQHIAEGTVPLALREVRLLALDHVALLAGTSYRGQYEERIRGLVEETTAAGDVILFVDELHNLVGQGTAIGVAMDAANMLKPALVRGDFRVIGATTDDEYERWIEGDPALERRFQKVAVRELGSDESLEILRARQPGLERHHNVVIADDALLAAVHLTERYVPDRRLPDKALDALDEACAHLQAVARYSPRAEEMIRERAALVGRRAADDAPPRPGVRSERGADQVSQFAQNGWEMLERFGAELEAAIAGIPGESTREPQRRTAEPAPSPRPTPNAERRTRLDIDLSRLLIDEGIVVRAHDVARVVSLMAGTPVTWNE